jgi:hypothetical protein
MEDAMMIYMLSVAMMLTMLIATAFALITEAGARRTGPLASGTKPLTRRAGR